jgi:ferritin-like metal-binding protein YciE
MAKVESTANGSTGSSKSGANPSGSAVSATGAGKEHKTLNDLLHDGLKDMLSGEKQLVEALPAMAKAAYSEELQDAFEKHLGQTKRHVERLEKVMMRLNISNAEEEQCEAMEGLIKEGKEIIERYAPGPVRDSALIIAAQKVEHYEIASYGSLCELCDVLGYSNLHDILGRTLDEEEDTDQDLTDLAQDINDEAYAMSMREERSTED